MSSYQPLKNTDMKNGDAMKLKHNEVPPHRNHDILVQPPYTSIVQDCNNTGDLRTNQQQTGGFGGLRQQVRRNPTLCMKTQSQQVLSRKATEPLDRLLRDHSTGRSGRRLLLHMWKTVCFTLVSTYTVCK